MDYELSIHCRAKHCVLSCDVAEPYLSRNVSEPLLVWIAVGYGTQPLRRLTVKRIWWKWASTRKHTGRFSLFTHHHDAQLLCFVPKRTRVMRFYTKLCDKGGGNIHPQFNPL